MTDTRFTWESSLYADASASTGRQFLASTLETFRGRLIPILTSIAEVLPGLTDHSIRHVDNLRQITAEFIGDDVLTAMEVFCLNACYLIHDACLSPLLYRGQAPEIRRSDVYQSLLSYHLRNERIPVTLSNKKLYAQKNKEPKDDHLFFETLRHLHAAQTRDIINSYYQKESSSAGDLDSFPVYLIDNADFRKHISDICGPISASHHQDIDEVQRALPSLRSFPPLDEIKDLSPGEREVRDVYLALILRICDACQLEGRAPEWMRLLRNPRGHSALHWAFQGSLAAQFNDGELSFRITTGIISESEADKWWLAYDYLRNVVVEEFNLAAKVIEKEEYPEFKIRKIGFIDNVNAFAELNRTTGWIPIDVSPTIRDPLAVIRSIGGEVLYGADPVAPFRELIQNALDASDAWEAWSKRLNPGGPSDAGPIVLEVWNTQEGTVVSIKDRGIGMSEYVLTKILPDFGRSIWASFDEHANVADLIREVRPRGRFGIGFFSVFMIAEKVQISTKYFKDQFNGSLIFGSGLGQRPIFRKLTDPESFQLGQSGTQVIFRLRPDLSAFDFSFAADRPMNIKSSLSSRLLKKSFCEAVGV